MSNWTVHLEFEEGTSSKFWRARVEGKTLYVNYGKIGTAGQTQVKELADAAAAARELDKLVREKRKKGYADAGGEGASEADDDEADRDEAEDGDGEGDGDDEADEAEAPKKKRGAKGGAAAAAPAARPAGGHRMTLDANGRKVEAHLYLEGKTVRMDAVETYASPDAAKAAYARLQKALGGDGFRD